MSAAISENAVVKLGGMDSTDPSYNPILQILDIKCVNTNKEGIDRFRIILSDGKFYIQGMLATQINEYVTNETITKNSIIRLREYIINKVKGQNLCVLLNIDVIEKNAGKVGTPVDIHKTRVANNLGGGGGGNNGNAHIAAPMYNRTNNNPYGGNKRNGNGSPSMKTSNPYSSPTGRNSYNGQSSFGGGVGSNAPIVQQRGGGTSGPRVTPISQLNMYQNRPTIKGRVTSKGDVKTWSNSKGEGTLMSIEVLDAGGTDIRITMFKEAVDKYQDYFVVGDVYTITGGRLKVANQQYNTCKSQYEMTIDVNTEVAKVEDCKDIKTQMFEFVKIGNLEQKEEKSYVDVIGIVQEVGEVQSLTSKRTGQELLKSDVTLIDDTGVQVRLTLWGNSASSATQKLAGQPVVAFRRARVSDYGGKTLSGGDMFVEPDVPETEDIRRWWNSQGSRSAPVKSLSSSGGGGKMDGFNDRKSIADIKGQHLGRNNEKGDYLTFKAHFTFLKKDKEGGAWYTACPRKEDPCRNRCKINQTTDGNYHCDRCSGTFPDCNRKWIFSGTVTDGTAQSWVSVFDEQAQELLGATADDMFAQLESQGQDHYDATFAKAAFSEWIFKCRVKEEEVNGETRLKAQVVRMEPVNYVTECRDIIAALERM